MKNLLFFLLILATNCTFLKAEDNYFDQLPTVTDTIRFNNFEYSVDTKYIGNIRQNRLTDKEYRRLTKLSKNAFNPDWRFECVLKFDSLIVAYFYPAKDIKSTINIVFFDKNKYNLDSIKAFHSLGDSINFIDLKNRISISTKSMILRQLDLPLPKERIPKSVVDKIQKEINEAYNKEKTLVDNGKQDSIEFGGTLDDYGVYYDTEKHKYRFDDDHSRFDYLDKYYALFINEDSNFYISYELKSRDLEIFENNLPHFNKLIQTFQFISDTYHLDTNNYIKRRKYFDYNSPLFYSAYKENSKEALECYLRLLSEYKPSISDSLLSLKPIWEQEIYQIYGTFFNPENPFQVTYKYHRQKKIDVNDTPSLKYYLIQGNVDVDIVDTISIPPNIDKYNHNADYNIKYGTIISELTIKEFHPKIKFPNSRIVYLDEFLEKHLKKFLKSQFRPLGYSGIMNPVSASDLSYIRAQFLNNVLDVYPHHWIEDWYLENHPKMSFRLNKNFDIAVVHVYYKYRFGRFILKKENDKWILIDGRSTAVE